MTPYYILEKPWSKPNHILDILSGLHNETADETYGHTKIASL